MDIHMADDSGARTGGTAAGPEPMSEAQSAAAASSSPAEVPLRRADELDPVAKADTQRTVK
eukprot:5323969-Prorocentrum_lima.AAC.1